jgi:hypothetical protein
MHAKKSGEKVFPVPGLIAVEYMRIIPWVFQTASFLLYPRPTRYCRVSEDSFNLS